MAEFAWFGMCELFLIGISVVAGHGLGRVKRPHFAASVLLVSFGLLAALMLILTQDAPANSVALRIWLALTVTAASLGPILWYQSPSRSAGSSDADGGGGSPTDPPPSPQTPPRGHVPLGDADQASVRVRDHNRPRLRDSGRRRRSRERRPVG